MSITHGLSGEKRLPAIFNPHLEKIPCKGGMKCPRCHREIYWLYAIANVIDGYCCIDCLITVVDVIVKATGIRKSRDHA